MNNYTLNVEALESKASTIVEEEESTGDNLIDEKSSIEDQCQFEQNAYELRHLYRDYKEGSLILQPEYQREYVWDNSRASSLVGSVLLGMPIPAIFLAETDKGKEVIDGQQRLTSLFNFMDIQFKLTNHVGVEGFWKKSFKDLEEKYKEKIWKYKIPTITIKRDNNPNIVFKMFEKINSGSIKLNAQELRSCLYRGDFNNVIKKLSQDSDFIYICNLENRKAAKRKAYEELVLLFFTVLGLGDIRHLSYSLSTQKLNQYMSKSRTKTETDLKEEIDKFLDAVKKIKQIFDKNAFRMFVCTEDKKCQFNAGSKGFNRGLFVSMMYVFSNPNYTMNQLVPYKDVLSEKMKQLMLNDDFSLLCMTNTMSKRTIIERTQKIEELVKSTIEYNLGESRRLFSYEKKLELFHRSPICKICQNKIDNIDDAEVDHIIPYSQGGQTIDNNAQLAHRYCNRSKKDRYTTHT